MAVFEVAKDIKGVTKIKFTSFFFTLYVDTEKFKSQMWLMLYLHRTLLFYTVTDS